MTWRQSFWICVVAGLGCAAMAGVAEKHCWLGGLVADFLLIFTGGFIAHASWARTELKAERREAAKSRQTAALLSYCSKNPEIGAEEDGTGPT